jgi:hypothetical protein
LVERVGLDPRNIRENTYVSCPKYQERQGGDQPWLLGLPGQWTPERTRRSSDLTDVHDQVAGTPAAIRHSAGGTMKRRAPVTPGRLAVQPTTDFEVEEDSVELLVTEENGSSSRVICIPIDGDPTGITTIPPPPVTPPRAG